MTRSDFTIKSSYRPEEVKVLSAAYRKSVEVLCTTMAIDANSKAHIASLVLINFSSAANAEGIAQAVIEQMSRPEALLSRAAPTLLVVMTMMGCVS